MSNARIDYQELRESGRPPTGEEFTLLCSAVRELAFAVQQIGDMVRFLEMQVTNNVDNKREIRDAIDQARSAAFMVPR